MLDPDWSRVGQDIVGGNPFPTFDAAFSLDGTVPEPSTLLLVGSGFVKRSEGRFTEQVLGCWNMANIPCVAL
jgi:hypothetical protein